MRWFGCFLIVLSSSVAHSQKATQADSIPARAFASSLYNRTFRNQSMLYNGNEYVAFDGPARGFRYFLSEYPEEGSITYEGETFKNIPLLYDVVSDEVVIEHYDQSGYGVDLKLHKERVTSFTLLGHYFVHLSADTMNGASYRSGFYDLLHDGQTKLLARRRKESVDQIDQGILTIHFSETDRYLLRLNGVYYSVKNRHSLLKLLKDQRKELVHYIRKMHFDFTLQRERSLVEIVRYYDKLKSPHE